MLRPYSPTIHNFLRHHTLVRCTMPRP
jgi:hypothetical protein